MIIPSVSIIMTIIPIYIMLKKKMGHKTFYLYFSPMVVGYILLAWDIHQEKHCVKPLYIPIVISAVLHWLSLKIIISFFFYSFSFTSIVSYSTKLKPPTTISLKQASPTPLKSFVLPTTSTTHHHPTLYTFPYHTTLTPSHLKLPPTIITSHSNPRSSNHLHPTQPSFLLSLHRKTGWGKRYFPGCALI